MSYPVYGWVGPSSVSLERWACWTPSQPRCSPLTRCQWTWSSPETPKHMKYIQTTNFEVALSNTETTSPPHTHTFELSMISGALYQRVATYSVKKPVWSCSGSAIRARPKSQICEWCRGSEVKNISLAAYIYKSSPQTHWLFKLNNWQTLRVGRKLEEPPLMALQLHQFKRILCSRFTPAFFFFYFKSSAHFNIL